MVLEDAFGVGQLDGPVRHELEQVNDELDQRRRSYDDMPPVAAEG